MTSHIVFFSQKLKLWEVSAAEKCPALSSILLEIIVDAPEVCCWYFKTPGILRHPNSATQGPPFFVDFTIERFDMMSNTISHGPYYQSMNFNW